MHKKKIATICAAAIFASATALAGLTQPAPVTVDLATGIASGDQVTARYSKNTVEFIGCGIRKISSGGAILDIGFCQASDAAGVQFTCFSQDPNLLSAISASGDFGFITFGWDLATDECNRIGFSNQSFYLPAKLDAN